MQRTLAAAVGRARSGSGPTLVECTTFRLHGHYFGDPMRYIPVDELAAARAAEPVARYRRRLVDEGVLDEVGATDIEQRAADEVEVAFAAALDAEPVDAGDATTDVYAEPSGAPT